MSRANRLEWLGLGSEDWGPCFSDEFSHNEFAATWRGNVPCPSDEQLMAAAPLTPSKEVQITETLRTVGKGNSRALVQTIILLSESVLIPKLTEDYGVSIEFAKMGAYARNPTYRSAVDCEAACRAIETAV